MTKQHSKQTDESPLGQLDARLPFEITALPCNTAPIAAPHLQASNVITQDDLDKVLAQGCFTAKWDPKKWKRIRTLAPAFSGSGTVDLMRSRENSAQRVAVKKLPRELMKSCPEEFKKEYPSANEHPWKDIAIVKYLNGNLFPYTCELFGVFLGSATVYIVTSFGTRGDLFAWCQNSVSEAGEAREAAVRPIVSQLFTGVCWLHNLGIAHRDLSVENVLLTDTREKGLQVKVIDFGMASLSRTACGEVVGKRSYQAPEMHSNIEYDMFPVDNFAVGVIFYCMVVGYYPWEETKPGKDHSFEYAREHGLGVFFKKKRIPCDQRPIAAVFSKSLLEILAGLLDFAPEMRYTLGEQCFECDRALSPLMQKQISPFSQASTVDSLCEVDFGEEVDLDAGLDDDLGGHSQSRVSIWHCPWLLANYVPESDD